MMGKIIMNNSNPKREIKKGEKHHPIHAILENSSIFQEVNYYIIYIYIIIYIYNTLYIYIQYTLYIYIHNIYNIIYIYIYIYIYTYIIYIYTCIYIYILDFRELYAETHQLLKIAQPTHRHCTNATKPREAMAHA